MNTTILAENTIQDVTKFSMEAAIKRGCELVGISLLGMDQLEAGKLYSPTRPITMKKGTGGGGSDYNPSTNVTPDMALQFLGRTMEEKVETLEFLGADQIYTLTTDVAFPQLEPLYFVRQVVGGDEMNREFCLFDVFGVDFVVSELEKRCGNLQVEDEKEAKALYTSVIKEILDPLIDENMLIEYKVLDGGEKTLICQAKTTPRGTYVRLELGL